MTQRETATICNRLGLHARSASTFVKTASAFSSAISVTSQFATANGKSIMSMLLLQASKGAEITLEISGDDEAEAMAALVALIENGFGED